jgi:cytochrome c-type biogenesis protein CcmH
MALWLLFLVMTAIAIAVVVWPLSRKAQAAADGNDVAVYRDQLEEIERDRAMGAIGAAEADAARTEVSRRLLAAADAAGSAVPAVAAAEPTWRRRLVGLATLVLVPLGAASLYLVLGSPELPYQPLAERMAKVHAGVPMAGQAQGQSIEALVARVEAYLDKNPDDGRGWEVIAPVYMRVGNYEGAAKARTNALRLLGPTADREADLGEAMVAAADGTVTAEARAGFERAIKLDPRNVSARFYLGLASQQDGRPEDAVSRWQALLADAPPDATWTDFVRRAIAGAQGRPDASAATAQAPAGAPPSAGRATSTADVANAIGMAPSAPPAQPEAGEVPQNDMIKNMVARLAERLKQDGSDVEGWLRLVRSYVVLGDPDKARAAAGDARQALGADPEKLRRLNAGVKELGLEG